MKYISFSSECNIYNEAIDNFTIEGNHEALRDYLPKVKLFADLHESPEYAPIFYSLGTGNSILADYYRRKDETTEEATKYRKTSLYYFRKTLSLLKPYDVNQTLLLSIYTNYANGLEACGRITEALRIYRAAIMLNPKFSMAIANYGRSLKLYANLVNDSGHSKDLHCYAYQAIKLALNNQDESFHEQAFFAFKDMIREYDTSQLRQYLSKPIRYKKYCLGRKNEQEYRLWCLKHHLYLNPLNDLLDQETAFAHDPLTITHYTESVSRDDIDTRKNGEPPKWFAMLNQLKEEYIFARYLCYVGSEKICNIHYADKKVKLTLSSFDYVNYSIRLEQLKAAFKTLYSTFDQIAFFINEFWSLGLGEKQADAAHVFKSKKYPIDNSALLAIFWSHSELVETFGEAESASEGNLRTLRNAIEHKFVKIHQYPTNDKLQIEDDSFYHISENELKNYVLRLLELSREWILELVYGIGIEERKNANGIDVIKLNIVDFDDTWKV